MQLKETELLSEKIEKYLVDQLKRGSLKQGDRLLSEAKIGELFHASNVPVRQAMRKLVNQGILEKIHGKGTFIRKALVKKPRAKTNRLGVLNCFKRSNIFSSAFYMSILEGIETEAALYKKGILFKGTAFLREHEDPNEVLLEMKDEVDGLVILGIFPQIWEAIYPTIRTLDRSVVTANFENAPADINTVSFDGRANGRAMTEFLISLGHERIGCICNQGQFGKRGNYNILQRLAGYKDALAEQGIKPDPVWISTAYSYGKTEMIRKMLSLRNRPTAIFCSNDHTAFQVCTIAQNMGLKVPEDLTIVGYDDIPECERWNPPLTTVHTPQAEMGREAVRLVMEKEKDRELPKRIVLPGTVVERESHRKINPK